MSVGRVVCNAYSCIGLALEGPGDRTGFDRRLGTAHGAVANEPAACKPLAKSWFGVPKLFGFRSHLWPTAVDHHYLIRAADTSWTRGVGSARARCGTCGLIPDFRCAGLIIRLIHGLSSGRYTDVSPAIAQAAKKNLAGLQTISSVLIGAMGWGGIRVFLGLQLRLSKNRLAN